MTNRHPNHQPGQLLNKDQALASLQGLSSSVIADAMYALGLPDTVLDPGVRLMAGHSLLGTAVTISRIPVRDASAHPTLHADLSAAIQQVIDHAPAGSVLITATQGEISHANWGSNQAIRARQVGMAGMVTDGAIRDLDDMDELGLTVFARATSPRSGQQRFITNSKNSPVVCAGVVIHPGDIIVGDTDGIVVVRPDDAARVAEKAHDIVRKEAVMHQHTLAGGTLTDAKNL